MNSVAPIVVLQIGMKSPVLRHAYQEILQYHEVSGTLLVVRSFEAYASLLENSLFVLFVQELCLARSINYSYELCGTTLFGKCCNAFFSHKKITKKHS